MNALFIVWFGSNLDPGLNTAKRIGIVYCERIQDASCVGCAKC